MPILTYNNKSYSCRANENVLQAFLRQGVTVPFSCRKGTCHVCMQRCTAGSVPAVAQEGIKPDLQQKGYFLACLCTPESDMMVEPPRQADLSVLAVIHRKELLTENVCRLLVETSTILDYRAGQFINLRRQSDGLTRPYSLASIPGKDYFLELHVKRMPNGIMSNWIFEELQEQNEIAIQGPLGNNFYRPGKPDQSMLLVAGGTGLAPMLGILRDALTHNHEGNIYIYHGGCACNDIYMHKEMTELAGERLNLHYNACLSGGKVPAGMLAGQVHEVAFSLHDKLAGWKVYLAGSPQMVHAAEQAAKTAGVEESDIQSDPFDFRDLRVKTDTGPNVSTRREMDQPASTGENSEIGYPASDLDLWLALDDGRLLHAILKDFYDRVYRDKRLAPFFDGVTKQRLIEKQFLFLRQIFTGEKVYFGNRPRNAHHWMVISDELFDYREELMISVLRQHSLPEHLIERWCAVENSFRGDIVKDAPRSRMIDGMELPLEGFGETMLDSGTLCDSCSSEIAVGTMVRYHVRLGTTYCPSCMDNLHDGKR